MGPNGSSFPPAPKEGMLTLDTAYTHIDTQSPHNGLEIPTIFSSQCSQVNSRQLQTKIKPGDFKASIRSSIENLKYSFNRLTTELKIKKK